MELLLSCEVVSSSKLGAPRRDARDRTVGGRWGKACVEGKLESFGMRSGSEGREVGGRRSDGDDDLLENRK